MRILAHFLSGTDLIFGKLLPPAQESLSLRKEIFEIASFDQSFCIDMYTQYLVDIAHRISSCSSRSLLEFLVWAEQKIIENRSFSISGNQKQSRFVQILLNLCSADSDPLYDEIAFSILLDNTEQIRQNHGEKDTIIHNYSQYVVEVNTHYSFLANKVARLLLRIRGEGQDQTAAVKEIVEELKNIVNHPIDIIQKIKNCSDEYIYNQVIASFNQIENIKKQLLTPIINKKIIVDATESAAACEKLRSGAQLADGIVALISLQNILVEVLSRHSKKCEEVLVDNKFILILHGLQQIIL